MLTGVKVTLEGIELETILNPISWLAFNPQWERYFVTSTFSVNSTGQSHICSIGDKMSLIEAAVEAWLEGGGDPSGE